MSEKITRKPVRTHRSMSLYGLLSFALLSTAFNATAQNRDYGDAPVTYGTTIATSGPAHIVPGHNSLTNTSSLMLGCQC